MKAVRIVGVGSPSGDDEAGWLTIDALQDDPRIGDVALVKLDRPGSMLITHLQGASWVIVVDAMHGVGNPGDVRRCDERDWGRYRAGLSSHGLGVLDALRLAQSLGSLPPRLDLYGIEIASARAGERAGTIIRAAARALAWRIARQIEIRQPAHP